MKAQLQQAYRECARITRLEARNFYYAFVVLPPARRRAIYAIYSYCRIVDDTADMAHSADEARQKLSAMRQQLDAALSGRPQGAVFTALADVKVRFGLKPELLYAVMDGVLQDLTITRYDTFAELRAYCWRVASAVGLLSLEVFGYTDSSARKYAEDLGIAMQLTNILRDVREDFELGRIYLPQEELAQYGITTDALAHGQVDKPWCKFMEFQVGRAREFYASASKLVPLVFWPARSCPIMLQAVYSRILDQIEEAGYDVFTRRLGPSNTEKISLLLRSWSQWLVSLPQPHRE